MKQAKFASQGYNKIPLVYKSSWQLYRNSKLIFIRMYIENIRSPKTASISLERLQLRYDELEIMQFFWPTL